jgi:hypothetical protein
MDLPIVKSNKYGLGGACTGKSRIPVHAKYSLNAVSELFGIERQTYEREVVLLVSINWS